MHDSLKTTFLDIDGVSIFTSYRATAKARSDNLTLVVLHGAGQSNSERFVPLAEFFAGHGIPVVSLDFVGHGKTGGDMSDNSLALRTKHALAVIGHWTDADTPLILCGSSMSGHTALRVSAELGEQIKSLWLMQPAVYAKEAEELFFGPDFSKILRTPESWRSSLALKDAAAYTGKALISIGSDDKVIPWGVVEELEKSLKQHTTQVRLDVFDGVGHALSTWLPDHEQACEDALRYLASYDG